jgi:class 3 adenylate cyclase
MHVTEPGYESDGVMDDLALHAPTLANDGDFREWWRNAGERSASPSTARAMDQLFFTSDVRSVLPSINAPTLVLHRKGNALVRACHGRYLAEHIAGAELIEIEGADHLPFVGDTEEVVSAIQEFLTGSPATPHTDRVLATILFTDIVDSTRRAIRSGDGRWRETLDDHDHMAARQVGRFGGRIVESTGDGLLATFDGPARAVRAALAIADGARQLGLEIRAGVHVGEVERRDQQIAGIAVHLAARIESAARPGEVWVSRTVRDLVAGSGLQFSDRGEHELKGIPEPWQLLAAESGE